MAQKIVRPPILKNHGDGYVMIGDEDFEIAKTALKERRAVQLPKSGHIVLREADAAIIRAVLEEKYDAMNFVDAVYIDVDGAFIYIYPDLSDTAKETVMFFLKRTLPLQTPK